MIKFILKILIILIPIATNWNGRLSNVKTDYFLVSIHHYFWSFLHFKRNSFSLKNPSSIFLNICNSFLSLYFFNICIFILFFVSKFFEYLYSYFIIFIRTFINRIFTIFIDFFFLFLQTKKYFLMEKITPPFFFFMNHFQTPFKLTLNPVIITLHQESFNILERMRLFIISSHSFRFLISLHYLKSVPFDFFFLVSI